MGRKKFDKRNIGNKKNIGGKASYTEPVLSREKGCIKKEGKREILSGIHPIREALMAGQRKIFRIFLSKSSGNKNKRIRRIVNLSEKAGVPVESVRPEYLDEITEYAKHQGIAAQVSAFPFQQIKDVIGIIKNNSNNFFILIIENLEDPHNFGALVRTALCAGVDFIFISKDRTVSPLPSVSKASAGAMEHASICLMKNTVSVIKILKEHGFWIAGLDADGSCSLFDADLTGRIALVVGGEHRGVRSIVKKECDFVLFLPMEGDISSLNASVAGGIAMYEVKRQRKINLS